MSLGGDSRIQFFSNPLFLSLLIPLLPEGNIKKFLIDCFKFLLKIHMEFLTWTSSTTCFSIYTVPFKLIKTLLLSYVVLTAFIKLNVLHVFSMKMIDFE